MALIASITSNIIANTADGGFYQLDVEISMLEAIASCDPQGYAKHEVAPKVEGLTAQQRRGGAEKEEGACHSKCREAVIVAGGSRGSVSCVSVCVRPLRRGTGA